MTSLMNNNIENDFDLKRRMMMNKRYLLTYRSSAVVKGGNVTFETFKWFDTEEEMDKFIDDSIREYPLFEVIQKFDADNIIEK